MFLQAFTELNINQAKTSTLFLTNPDYILKLLLVTAFFCWCFFFSCFSLGIWFLVCDHHQLCISSGSFYSAVYEQIILQDSPAVYGVSCCWCVEWKWNHSSHPSCKFHEINENIIFATFSFSNPFVNLLWLWCALPNHSGKCGFQTFQKVKCSPCFSRLYFQDIFYHFWQTFLASLSTGRDYCFIEQQAWSKKRKK